MHMFNMVGGCAAIWFETIIMRPVKPFWFGWTDAVQVVRPSTITVLGRIGGRKSCHRAVARIDDVESLGTSMPSQN